jgi:FAD/FMN-containing dehydrogenase
VLDLARSMAVVEVDAAAARARVGAGATLGQLYHAVGAASPTLAAVGGTCPSVGVGEHVLGGGKGMLLRRHGLACDRLLSLTLVDATGREVVAGAARNADLFWSACGVGGGNFGVVVEYVLALAPVPPTVTTLAMNVTGAAEGVAFLDAWQTWQGGADAALSTIANALPHGALLLGLFLGPAAELRTLLAGAALPSNATLEAKDMTWLESTLDGELGDRREEGGTRAAPA